MDFFYKKSKIDKSIGSKLINFNLQINYIYLGDILLNKYIYLFKRE